MDFQKLLIKISKILKQLEIPYAITGGYAVSVWGRPRSTLDIDVIIELYRPQVRDLVIALKKTSKISYIEEGTVLEAVEQIGEFNFIHGDTGIKIDFFTTGKDPFSKIKLERRIPKKILGKTVYFVSSEDLILSKLEWYKESQSSRHLEDVESIFKISAKKLDKKYLAHWAKKLKVEEIYCNALKAVV